VKKKIAGEHFEGLQFITKLLTPPGKERAVPLIEEVGGGVAGGQETTSKCVPFLLADHSDFVCDNFSIDQLPSATTSSAPSTAHGYGFGNTRTDIFATLKVLTS